MKSLKLIAALGLGALVSACGSVPDIASRNAPFEAAPQRNLQQVSQVYQPQTELPVSMRVSAINVRVPSNLKVSEANVYYPVPTSSGVVSRSATATPRSRPSLKRRS